MFNAVHDTFYAHHIPVFERKLKEKSSFKTGIVGNGNSARALAAYLKSKDHQVSFLARSEEKLAFLGEERLLKAEGKIEGSFKIEAAYADAAAFTAACEVIFIATITGAYEEIAFRLAPFLNETQSIILFSSKLGGSLLFETALKKAGAKLPRIIETDALFACRIKEEENSIWIRGFKEWTLFSSAKRSQSEENSAFMKKFFPGLSPAVNVIERGLTDFGAVAHAAIALANVNLISRKESFLFYYEGMTPETIRLLEAVEDEFRRLAFAYGSELIAMKDLLDRYYGCDNSSLYSAMTSVPNYRYSLGPDSLEHRFLHEDLCSTLVPAHYLAQLAGIETPVINGLVSIISAITRKNLLAEGRNLTSLGLQQLSYKEVYAYVNS
ncbi:MAG: NAD/NADP octopine/nopaline dehydrogenase family protein [Candidatus Obscuribacterales bacterium]|nr:NAD/NADP octopine/nopaline dehydrogenase family protein [Candidatus Obscuribacterales bacterium]